MRVLDYLIQIRRARPLLRRQFIKHLLHRICGVADMFQSDHASAAFQRMKRTAQRGEQFLILWIGPALRRSVCDSGQHFARFFEEDFEHLRVGITSAINRNTFLRHHYLRRRLYHRRHRWQFQRWCNRDFCHHG